jgi:hypothetical protein
MALSRAFGVDLSAVPARASWSVCPEPSWYEQWQCGLSQKDRVKGLSWVELLSRAAGGGGCAAVLREWHLLFEAGVRRWSGVTAQLSPFRDYLVAPIEVLMFQSRHAHTIESRAADVDEAVGDLLVELVEVIWGLAPSQSVSDAELKRLGIDPQEPPPHLE